MPGALHDRRSPGRALAAGCFLVTMFAAPPAAAAPPPWLRQAASAPANPEGSATAVVLLDEIDVVIDRDGRMRTTRRYAARILDRSARDAAGLREAYITGSGRIRGVRGWIVPASGSARDLGDADIADVAMVNNDVFNEVRIRAITARDQIAAGDVFGAEIESENRVLFAQIEWPLQERWAVRRVRRTLTLPAGWTVTSVTFNAPAIEPAARGTTWSWEATALAELPDEPAMPPVSAVVPRVAVSFFGTDADRAPGQFRTWREVSAWLDALSDPRAQQADAVAQKARQLARPAATELERLAAIARYAQKIQYVSIQTGLGRGGGYQPRPAQLVLERNYGDCKDKANLVRVMLSAIGVKAYLVSIFAGDRTYVRKEWPSPQQFNHAIVAISVTDDLTAPAVLEHASLGRLLLFDPTDEHTPFGELPLHEQGSLALIVDGAAGDLERMPVAPDEQHRTSRRVEGSIGADGTLAITWSEAARGAEASAGRAAAAALDAAAYRGWMERRVTAVVAGAHVVRIQPGSGEHGFDVAVEISAPAYGQRMGSLLILKPPLAIGDVNPAPAAGARRMPIQLESRQIEETLQLELPAEFAVDELPSPVSIEGPFGRYALSYQSSQGRVTARRTLLIRAQILPASEHAGVREFFEKIRSSDAAPVVLARR